MSQKFLILWFSFFSLIGVLFGIVYAFFGLGVLPVSLDVLVPWGNGVYGATFIGMNAIFFFIGRYALQIHDPKLMRALLYGIFTWLIVEALFSLYYKVFFNVGVDIALMVILGLPLIIGIKQARGSKKKK